MYMHMYITLEWLNYILVCVCMCIYIPLEEEILIL